MDCSVKWEWHSQLAWNLVLQIEINDTALFVLIWYQQYSVDVYIAQSWLNFTISRRFEWLVCYTNYTTHVEIASAVNVNIYPCNNHIYGVYNQSNPYDLFSVRLISVITVTIFVNFHLISVIQKDLCLFFIRHMADKSTISCPFTWQYVNNYIWYD